MCRRLHGTLYLCTREVCAGNTAGLLSVRSRMYQDLHKCMQALGQGDLNIKSERWSSEAAGSLFLSGRFEARHHIQAQNSLIMEHVKNEAGETGRLRQLESNTTNARLRRLCSDSVSCAESHEANRLGEASKSMSKGHRLVGEVAREPRT